MLRIAFVLSALVALVAGAPAEAKVRCSSGTTAFREGGLRIFGVHVDHPGTFGFVGFDEYACLDGAWRPMQVGREGASEGLALETPPYALARVERLLPAYDVDNFEGGARLDVVDL